MTATLSTDALNAAALSMLATHCGICRRALRDPISVELGIGPECRKGRFEESSAVSPEAYQRAKAIVYKLAIAASTDKVIAADVLVAADELQQFGFAQLADVLVKRNAKIQIVARQVEVDGVKLDKLFVHFPYNPDCGYGMRRLGGTVERHAVTGKRLGFVIPADRRNDAWAYFKRYFPGVLGTGPLGPFVA